MGFDVDDKFVSLCPAGPHNPHPPPASLAAPRGHVDDIVSARRSMSRGKLLTCLHTRIGELHVLDTAHRRRVTDMKTTISQSKSEQCAARTALSSVSQSVSWNSPKHLPKAERHSANTAVLPAGATLLELEQKLQRIKDQTTEELKQWEEKEVQLKQRTEAMRGQVVSQVLGERERDVLVTKTQHYRQIPQWRVRERAALEALERQHMLMQDDQIVVQLLPAQTVRTEPHPPRAPPPLLEDNCAVLNLDVLGIERIYPKHPKYVVKLKAFIRRTLKDLLSSEEYRSGHESAHQGCKSLVAFPTPYLAVKFAAEVLYTCHVKYDLHSGRPKDDPILLSYPPEFKRVEDGRLFRGPLLTMGIDYGEVKARVDQTTMRYTLRGRPVGYAAHATSQCRPGEALLTRAAFTALHKCDQSLVSILDLEEYVVGKEGYYSLIPCVCEEVGDGFATTEELLPNAFLRRKVSSQYASRGTFFAPLGIWWEYTGVHPPPAWELPFTPAWKLTHRPRYSTAMFEEIEFALMRHNDVSLRRPPPVGCITLVFTDVQGSTNLWDKQTTSMAAALRIHNNIMRRNIERFQGYEVRTEGDAFMIAFAETRLALAWCVKVQRELMEQSWPVDLLKEKDASDSWDYDRSTKSYVRLHHGVRVRMGLNVCEPDCEVDTTNGRMGYYGPSVHLAARISDTGKGGEITLGLEAYKELTKCECLTPDLAVIPLGRQVLSGLSKPESLFLVYPKELSARFSLRPKKEKVDSEKVRQGIAWAMLSKAPKDEGGPRTLTERHKQKLIQLDTILPQVKKITKVYTFVLATHETLLMKGHDVEATQVAPTGQVVIAFSDIQGSTALWDKNPDVMKTTIAKHNRILRSVGAECNAYEVKTEGDAFMMAFSCVTNALQWCCDAQLALLNAKWHQWIRAQPDSEVFYKDGVKIFDGPRVRMGFNIGNPKHQIDPVSGRVDYFGPMVNLSARISGVGKGGEIVVGFSAFTELTRLNAERDGAILAPYTVHDKGEVTLKGVSSAEFLHLIAPKQLSGRWVYWKREVPVKATEKDKEKDSFWCSVAPKLEAGKMHAVEVVAGSDVMIPAMIRDMARRSGGLRDIIDDGKRAKQACISHGMRVLSFVSQLYKLLLTNNGKFAPQRVRPLPLEEQHSFAKQLRPAYLAFQEEKDEVDEQIIAVRKRSLPTNAMRRPQDGYFNEKQAVQLIKEFENIDEDRSGTIHMNEVVGKTFRFSFLDEDFDERLFKRFDKDRDGVISIMEVFRSFFPKAKVSSMQKWLAEYSKQQAAKENMFRRNSELVPQSYAQLLNVASLN